MRNRLPAQPTAPALIAHRGAAALAPENTLAGFRLAAARGARWVEFDVRLARDGTPVLFHDATLERTSDGSGPVARATMDELARLDAGAWFGPGFAGERIPRLIEAIGELARLALGANIEIKAEPGAAEEAGAVVARTVRALWPDALPPPVLSSFSVAALLAARREAPDLARALVSATAGADAMAGIEDCGATALHCRHDRLRASGTARLVDSGLVVRAWTVNDPVRARELLSWGAQSVISDHPDLLDRSVSADTPTRT